MKKNIFLILFLISIISFSQPYFQRYDGCQVKINGNDINYPWAGGLNFIQASTIDLNLDGINDLFLFDRSGNKIRTFINNGTLGSVDYTYAPQYESKFPVLHDWVLLADYNCDGKTDVFSYAINNGAAGIQVYKNTSSIATGLQFTIVAHLLQSAYNPPNPSLLNLFVSSTDIPAISDIDGDGDLDIITFALGGVYMEYHLNKSKELYGTCDSLQFEVKNHCWGYAAESFMTNFYTLNDTCVVNVPNPQITNNNADSRGGQRHSGSCQLCIDLNGDGDKDFIGGDISYKNLTMLTNGGSPTAGHFTSMDPAFPLNNGGTAVNLAVFPCAFYTDINTDGKNDLIVSPNAPGGSENFTSMVYFENIGTSSFPVFQFRQSDVIQNNMIDVGEGAYPALFDYDNDGLKDLFIGNAGYYGNPSFSYQIAQFKNIGTATVPKYELVTRDYNNLSTSGIMNMVPSFGDLDGDGDGDMIIGDYYGQLHYFENTAAAGATANFVLPSTTLKNANNRTIDVGDAAAPHIADVDGDGKNDLIIGGRNGKLAYYRRINASGFPQMDSISHFFGKVNVTAPNGIAGYSFPFVFKQSGKTELLVGTESGYLHRYDDIDGNIHGTFNLVDTMFLNVREGANASPAGADVDNDGRWDLFVGNYSGGIGFYKGIPTAISEIENNITWNIEVYPNPANSNVTIQLVNDENKLFKLTIHNILGQLIASNVFSKKIIIPTENFKQGMYILKISGISSQGNIESGSIVKRLIIKHN